MPPTSHLDDIRVRRAVSEDAPIVARHRVSMFRDMGELTDPLEGPLIDASTAFFRGTIESGEYVAWLAAPRREPDLVISGAGVLLRPMLPRPTPAGIVQGSEALIANVYTEPAWRRRGVAALLMRHILDFTRANGIHRVLLHASKEGRPLYESLGFVPTSEMRLAYPG
ncbi:MAG TPA: GNAT family N-acetyltransferase [Gemmatimonadaceae bacterium]|nr:GNAT family N-acetyltransferase [Gemmatimonadaceae bacterium]